LRSVVTLSFVFVLGAEVARPPLGLDEYLPAPAANPLSRAKVDLGRRLFASKLLSRDGALSCATCHDRNRSFADGRSIARGMGGAEGTRNSPALINRGYGSAFFWDGRATSLEDQALDPITNPRELANSIEEVERRTGLKAAEIRDALASYMRTIRSGDSRFDRYTAGRTSALDGLEMEGLTIFRGKSSCTSCHIGPSFTDERFHNTGVAWRDGGYADDGRFAVTGYAGDRGAFKTPTLRDLTRTAPYMHDGSLASIEDVVDFYSDGGRNNPNLDAPIHPLNLTPREKLALAAFLRSVTGRVHEGM
jgi:cytochrome c peroxidase